HQFLELDLDQQANGWRQLTAFPSHLSKPSMFVQSDGEHNLVYLVAGSMDTVSGRSSGSIIKYDPLQKLWLNQSVDTFANYCSNLNAIATGSTYALISCGDNNDSLYLFNTITKRVTYLDTLPASQPG